MDRLAKIEAEIRKRLADDDFVDWDETPFVACDQRCFALKEPETIEQFAVALRHWRDHYLHGCSHGR